MTAPSQTAVTPAEINALPERIRRHIHDLATICDPAGMVQEIAALKDQIAQLIASRDAAIHAAEVAKVAEWESVYSNLHDLIDNHDRRADRYCLEIRKLIGALQKVYEALPPLKTLDAAVGEALRNTIPGLLDRDDLLPSPAKEDGG